jgi:transposase-like protein
MSNAYQDRRRARIKELLLPILQACEAEGTSPDIADLADHFGCGKSTLRQMRRELGQEGLIAEPEAKRVERLCQGEIPDLAARVAAVREARLRKWKSREARNPPPLTEAELEEVLP